MLRIQLPRLQTIGIRPRLALRTPLTPLRFYSAPKGNKLSPGSVPASLTSGPVTVKYTAEHEWIAVHPNNEAFVGITNYAADALGDATYVELPEKGSEFSLGDPIGGVESVKSASEIYAPVSGIVLEVNENLEDKPGIVNSDPMGDGWIAKIKLADAGELQASELLDEAAYEASLKE